MSKFTEFYVPYSGVPKNKQATLIVYGFDPIPDQLDPVIDHFSRVGDVFTYTYPNEIVAGGDPYLLPKLIGDLTARAADITADYDIERVRTVGASLGSCIAMNIQDELGLTTAGVYATAGVNVANNFMRNPIFKLAGVPKKMKDNGYSIDDVREIWMPIDIHAGRNKKETTRFWANASILDPVVWYPLAKQNLRHFNGGYTLQRSTALWHTAAINEMANHIAEATELADAIK